MMNTDLFLLKNSFSFSNPQRFVNFLNILFSEGYDEKSWFRFKQTFSQKYQFKVKFEFIVEVID